MPQIDPVIIQNSSFHVFVVFVACSVEIPGDFLG